MYVLHLKSVLTLYRPVNITTDLRAWLLFSHYFSITQTEGKKEITCQNIVLTPFALRHAFAQIAISGLFF